MNGSYIVIVLFVSLFSGICGCSKDAHHEAAERISLAGKVLSGKVRSDGGECVPQVVADQRRKEHIRQDSKWTHENQVRYPIEYCQAQLESLREHADRLDALRYKCTVAKNKALRGILEAESQLVDIEKFLEVSKAAYRKAEASEKWPVTIGGFSLSRENAQKKIVDAAERRPVLRSVIARNRNMIAALERKVSRIAEEQRKVIRIKEKTQLTLDGLKLKDTIDDDGGIVDALNAINDALGAIGIDYDDPSAEDLMVPGQPAVVKASFDAIMAE